MQYHSSTKKLNHFPIDKTRYYPNQNFDDILLSLILLTSPISNLALQGTTLGIFGASASIPFVALLFLSRVYKITIKSKKIKKNTALIALYAALLTLAYLLLSPPQIKNELTILKALKISIFYTLSVFLIFTPPKNIKTIITGAWGGLFICMISTIPFLSEVSILNYEGTSEGRPRGLTMESSHFAFIAGALALTIFSFEQKKSLKLVSFTIGAALLVYSQSKAGIVIYLLGYFASTIAKLKSKKQRVIALLTIPATLYLLMEIVIPYTLSRIANDMDNYTSTATRFVGVLSALHIVIYNPLGVGFGAYLEKIILYIPSAVETSRIYYPYLDYSEVTEYTTQATTRAISTKSFVADSIIYFGIPFIIFSLVKAKRLLSNILKNNKEQIIPGVTFVMLSLLFWNTGIGFYPAFILLSTTIKSSKEIS
jgi:hypothetical protein